MTLLTRYPSRSDPETRQLLLESDLQLTNASLKHNPKNYSVWEHRKWVLETMPDADWGMEMKMVDLYLEKDGRNCAFSSSTFSSSQLSRSV
jgi:geranylgeranyl transferase type-2 subunit alpha